jgi:hypothetical protein
VFKFKKKKKKEIEKIFLHFHVQHQLSFSIVSSTQGNYSLKLLFLSAHSDNNVLLVFEKKKRSEGNGELQVNFSLKKKR